MQTFCYFTYAADAEKLWQSIRSVRRHYPEDRIVVLMESGKEFSPGYQVDLREEWGCEIETTYWNRGGNLNGVSNAHGMWRTFDRMADAGGRVFKIDSDLILLKPPPDGNFICSWENRKAGRVIFGMLYGLEAETIKRLWAAWPKRAAEFMDMPKRRFAEDLFARYMLEAGKEPLTRLLYEDGVLAIWNYRKKLALSEFRDCYVANFGFRKYEKQNSVHASLMNDLNRMIEEAI